MTVSCCSDLHASLSLFWWQTYARSVQRKDVHSSDANFQKQAQICLVTDEWGVKMTQEPLMSKLACYSVSFKYTIKLCTVLHCDQLANSCVLPHRASKKSQIKNVQHTGGESCRTTAHTEVRGNKTLAQDCSRLAWAWDLWVLMNLYFSESSCNSVFPVVL